MPLAAESDAEAGSDSVSAREGIGPDLLISGALSPVMVANALRNTGYFAGSLIGLRADDRELRDALADFKMDRGLGGDPRYLDEATWRFLRAESRRIADGGSNASEPPPPPRDNSIGEEEKEERGVAKVGPEDGREARPVKKPERRKAKRKSASKETDEKKKPKSEAGEGQQLLPGEELEPRARRKAAAVGDMVFAVEKVECLYRGESWILAYEGKLNALDGEEGQVTLDKRYGIRFDPTKSGIATDDWFCVPKRRYCYSEVGFDLWDGAYEPGRTVSFPSANIEHKELGLIGLAHFLTVERCPREDTETKDE